MSRNISVRVELRSSSAILKLSPDAVNDPGFTPSIQTVSSSTYAVARPESSILAVTPWTFKGTRYENISGHPSPLYVHGSFFCLVFFIFYAFPARYPNETIRCRRSASVNATPPSGQQQPYVPPRIAAQPFGWRRVQWLPWRAGSTPAVPAAHPGRRAPVACRSGCSPVSMSMTSLARAIGSRGRFGRGIVRSSVLLCHYCIVRGIVVSNDILSIDHLTTYRIRRSVSSASIWTLLVCP